MRTLALVGRLGPAFNDPDHDQGPGVWVRTPDYTAHAPSADPSQPHLATAWDLARTPRTSSK